MVSLLEQDLLERYGENPLITAADIPFTCNTVFNGGAVKRDGQYTILLRVEGQHGYSVFALARSSDGYNFEIERLPVMTPATEGPMEKYEVAGIEDPRITVIDGATYIVYTAFSGYGPCMALATTEDFSSFERRGLISEPGNKDGLLFPRKVGGRYVRFDRPIGNDIGRVWVTFSDDLHYWGDSRVVLSPRPGYWDSYRVGASCVPIETDVRLAGDIPRREDDERRADLPGGCGAARPGRPVRRHRPQQRADPGARAWNTSAWATSATWSSPRRPSSRTTGRSRSTTAPPTRPSAWPARRWRS